MAEEKTRDRILHFLEHGKKYTPGQIAKGLGLKQSTISRQLKRMEAKGLVKSYGKTSNRYYELIKSVISTTQNPAKSVISGVQNTQNVISQTVLLLRINARAFKDMVAGVASLADEALIQVYMDGVMIRQMDPSGISWVDARIPKAQFTTYNINTPVKIGVNLETLSKKIERFPDKNELDITVEDKEGLILRSGWRVVNLITLDKNTIKVPDVPRVKDKAAAEIDGKLLHECIKDLIEVGSHATVRITRDSFTLFSKGDSGKVSNTFSKPQVKTNTTAGEQVATYDLEYLEDMLNIIKKKDIPVTINLTTNEPIRVSYSINGVVFTYYLAPYMEDA